MGLFVTYPSYITLMASIGVLLGLANILIMSYFQAVVPDELRGRVFGLVMTLSGGLQPPAFPVFVTRHVGTRFVPPGATTTTAAACQTTLTSVRCATVVVATLLSWTNTASTPAM